MADLKPRAVIRPGLLDRLKINHGIATDDAFAGAIGVSPSTLSKLRKGAEPSIGVIVSISRAFNLGLGEVAMIDEVAGSGSDSASEAAKQVA